jgi:hypothetical protein
VVGGIYIKQAKLERLRRELKQFKRGIEVKSLGELTISFNNAISADNSLPI